MIPLALVEAIKDPKDYDPKMYDNGKPQILDEVTVISSKKDAYKLSMLPIEAAIVGFVLFIIYKIFK